MVLNHTFILTLVLSIPLPLTSANWQFPNIIPFNGLDRNETEHLSKCFELLIFFSCEIAHFYPSTILYRGISFSHGLIKYL